MIQYDLRLEISQLLDEIRDNICTEDYPHDGEELRQILKNILAGNFPVIENLKKEIKFDNLIDPLGICGPKHGDQTG